VRRAALSLERAPANEPLDFELAADLEAHEPPEARGIARDAVRLLVAQRSDGSIVHARFHDLSRFLRAGDLLVVNTSATLAAALPVRRADGSPLELRLSTPAPPGPAHPAASDIEARHWVVELRDGDRPYRALRAGERLALPAAASAELLAPFASGVRLWLARLDLPLPLSSYLRRHGHPIRYRYVPREWPLSAYQNVYANEPGSAEMASAGRPFTVELITRLIARGVQIAPITLHAGVSSPERGEPPQPEPYRVPPSTAQQINAVHAAGGLVIAVGTTVVRALESAAADDGAVRAADGWTRLVVDADRGLRIIDGLITGWHEPRASHLDMLAAAAGLELLRSCYLAALAQGYLWHEFGDSHLILP
jgi:S-adenosylmethionine:tRNA ribosyltransferase-isomerase